MIVVDPRFTRTAATADLFLQIRAGADIAFLGGMIHYALENQRIAKEYLVNFTNAAFVIKEGFKLPEDGLYSGFDEGTQTYDKSTWNYEEGGNLTGKAAVEGRSPDASAAPAALPPNVAYDTSLEHPRCVYQLLKKQYSRYTPEMVERITGHSEGSIPEGRRLFTSIRKDGDTKKVATIIYAVGWTQHTFGTQIIRTAAMLQLLMGNVGRAGGGVNALRGHSNIQGATDVAGIFDNLPGYLKVPTPADKDFAAWMKRITPKASKPIGMGLVQLLVQHAEVRRVVPQGDVWRRRDKRERLGVSPICRKSTANIPGCIIWDDMYRGKVKGLLAFGMNGVAIGPNSQKNIDALKKADWLVVCDIYPDETSEFWRSPGITPEEMKNIKTEVYRLPGAGFAEKDGTFVNSARWLQWKWAAVPPPGEAKLDQEILARIFLKVRELYQKEGGKFPDPILNLAWNYTSIPKIRRLSEVAKELNGRALSDVTDEASGQVMKAGQQLPGFSWLRDDGSTSCGNWIWCGSWTEAGALTQRRGTDDPSGLGIYPNWAWSWPMNRRVLYNRASCDVAGKPWDPDRRQIWWNEAQKRWVGNDVPDFKADSAPKDHMGPFIMNPEGVGRLFVPLAGMADGPFPEHLRADRKSDRQSAASAAVEQSGGQEIFTTDMDKYGTPEQGFNIVCTTYRLTEHYHYWTKNNPMNVQLVPEPFVEIPVELADEMGIAGRRAA